MLRTHLRKQLYARGLARHTPDIIEANGPGRHPMRFRSVASILQLATIIKKMTGGARCNGALAFAMLHAICAASR